MKRTPYVVLAGAVGLVVAAIVVGQRLNAEGVPLHAAFPPLSARWVPHVGVGTPAVAAIAVLVIAYGPRLAEQMRWRRLLWLATATSFAWITTLGLADGWDRFSTRLSSPGNYLVEVPRTDWSDLLHGFTDRIVMDAPDNWVTHVAGHPPGALAVFLGLDRIGLGGQLWATAVCIVAGATVAAAVAVALRGLGSEEFARRALPFLVLTPAAIWLGTSPDAIFAAVTTWGLALLVVATRTRGPARVAGALGAGLLLGSALYLSYGLALFGLLVIAVLVRTRDVKAVSIAAVPVALIVGLVTLGGFAWWEGYDRLVVRYYEGWGGERPYSYWVWADLAVLAIVIGPAAIAALWRGLRTNGVNLVIGAALIAVVAATLSGLSKAEVERIWLPYAVWLVAACGALPIRGLRWWLAAQAVLALLVEHLLLTAW